MRFKRKKIAAVAGFACCLLALCSTAKAADNPSHGVAVKGQSGVFCSLVKSKDFPVGRQHVAAYGGSVGYYAVQMSHFAFSSRHQTVRSAPRGLLLYRSYGRATRSFCAPIAQRPCAAWSTILPPSHELLTTTTFACSSSRGTGFLPPPAAPRMSFFLSAQR